MNKRKMLIESGIKLTGVVGKALVELIPGGLFIPILGELVGTGIEAVFNDFADRTLSNREKVKISAAFIFAASKLNERMQKGDRIRDDDWFFPNNENCRSSSEEILEGIVIKSKIEHEELKIKYMGNIYANAAFSKYMVEELNLYLRIAENLTYRQLCILACIKNKTIALRETDISYHSIKQIAILQEMNNLSQQGIIEMYAPEKDDNDFGAGGMFRVSQRGEFQPIYSWEEIIPSRLVLTKLGESIYDIMGLEEVPTIDIEKKLSDVKN